MSKELQDHFKDSNSPGALHAFSICRVYPNQELRDACYRGFHEGYSEAVEQLQDGLKQINIRGAK